MIEKKKLNKLLKKKEHAPEPPIELCGNRLHQKMGIVSPSRDMMYRSGMIEKTPEIKEYYKKLDQYLLKQRIKQRLLERYSK